MREVVRLTLEGHAMKPAALVACLFLAIVAIAHLLRLVFAVPVVVADVTVPVWMSGLAVLGPGALAVWLWREQRRTTA